MSRKPLMSLTVILALTACAAIASSAIAKEGGASESSRLAGGVYVFTRDVPLPILTPLKQGVVGLGYEMNGRWGSSPHWGWNASFGYGVGSWKEESGGTEDKLSLSHWEARVGMDWWDDCCDQEFYCGPGLIYMSSKLKEESTGNPDVELDPIKTIGLDARAGGQFHLGTNARMFGSMDAVLGSASYDENGTKVSGWVNSFGWRGGVRFNF